MRVIIYYIFLLLFIGLIAGFLFSQKSSPMAMGPMLGVSAALVVYTVAMSLVGEKNNADEREQLHKNLANRYGLIAGTIVFSAGVLYQLFVAHQVDYWLLSGLIVVNITKLISLMYLNYNR